MNPTSFHGHSINCVKYLLIWTAVHVLSLVLACAQKPIGAPSGAGDNRSGQRESTNSSISELVEEIRELKSEVDKLRRQNSAILDHLTFTPEGGVQDEDYVQARSRFQTKLVRKGSAPQRWSPVKPPAGVSEIEYDSGELRLKAWVNRPTDEERQHPAVLFLHGGFAFGMGDWDQTKPYRDAGFVVLTPMLRGENGQAGAFSYFYDEVDDVLAAAEYLSKQPYVDARRLFVAGHSIGGTMTLLTALTSDRFRAAASFDGFPYWGPLTEATDLPFDKSDPREIQLRSALAYAGSVKCPLRIYHQARERGGLMEFLGLISRRMVVLAKNRGLDGDSTMCTGTYCSGAETPTIRITASAAPRHHRIALRVADFFVSRRRSAGRLNAFISRPPFAHQQPEECLR